jgi:hypothetical protein
MSVRRAVRARAMHIAIGPFKLSQIFEIMTIESAHFCKKPVGKNDHVYFTSELGHGGKQNWARDRVHI